MKPSAPLVVAKLGGSLFANRDRLAAAVAAVASLPARVVVLPGGGAIADGVRAAQGAAGFSDALAHRLALTAMEQMADVLAELFPACRIAATPADVADAHRAGALPVWRDADAFLGPDVPESWDVTSDSLAAVLAAMLDADRLLLLKSAPPPATGLAELAASGYVDPGFPRFAARFGGPVDIAGPAELAGLAARYAFAPDRRAAS